MTDLPQKERMQTDERAICRRERLCAPLFQPDKINLASLGNHDAARSLAPDSALARRQAFSPSRLGNAATAARHLGPMVNSQATG
jgi:hypothetical protein